MSLPSAGTRAKALLEETPVPARGIAEKQTLRRVGAFVHSQGRFGDDRRTFPGARGFEVRLVDLVAPELFANAPARQAAMGRAAVNPPAVAVQDADEVGTLHAF